LSAIASATVSLGAFTLQAPSTRTASTTVSSAGFNAPTFASNNNGNSNNGNSNNANNNLFNGAFSGFPNNQNQGAPWGNNNNGVDADTVINDNNRFNQASIAGTWAIQASGFAHRPHVDHKGKLWYHPVWNNDTVASDVAVDFVGLLCIDRNNGCSVELIVNIAGQEAILRGSDQTCTAQVHGNGQGFIRTNLKVTAGCDRHMVFPTSLVLPFVIGENGEGFFLVTGCLFGLDESPFKHGNSALPGVFGCKPAHSNSDESDVSGLAPITMSGEMNRQNGEVRQNNKNQWSMNNNMGPWADSSSSNNNNNNGNTGSGNNGDWGRGNGNSCNCNNWVSANGNNNPCNCRDQDHCLPFDNFLLPFSMHQGTPSGTCGEFQQFRAGCMDPMWIVGGHELESECDDWPW
jgi:hypothetical protein